MTTLDHVRVVIAMSIELELSVEGAARTLAQVMRKHGVSKDGHAQLTGDMPIRAPLVSPPYQFGPPPTRIPGSGIPRLR